MSYTKHVGRTLQPCPLRAAPGLKSADLTINGQLVQLPAGKDIQIIVPASHESDGQDWTQLGKLTVDFVFNELQPNLRNHLDWFTPDAETGYKLFIEAAHAEDLSAPTPEPTPEPTPLPSTGIDGIYEINLGFLKLVFTLKKVG